MIAATSLGRDEVLEQHVLDVAVVAVGRVVHAGSSGLKPWRYFALLAVSERLPSLRPWNAPRNAITYCRPVAWRASLIDASTASVPELVRNTLLSPAIGARATSRSRQLGVDRAGRSRSSSSG